MTLENSSSFGALPPEQNPFYKSEQKKNISRIGLGLLLYSAVAALLQMSFMTVVYYAFPSFYETEIYNWILQAVPSYCVAFPLFCLFLSGMPKQAPEKKKLSGENAIAFLSISFLLVLVGNLISTALMSGFEFLRGTEISNVVDTYMDSYSPLLSFALFVVFAPIAEEVMFRKLIIDRLLPYSEWMAVVTSALLFGLMHGNFYQFFYATFLGVLFSYVYARTGKILHTIIMHMIINFTGSIIASTLMELVGDTNRGLESITWWDVLAVVYSIALWALVICGGILLFQNFKKLELKKTGNRWLTLKTQFKLLFSSAGTIVYCVICLLTFISSLFI